MAAFILWCILFVLCWPLALLVAILVPILWILGIPIRIFGWTIRSLFGPSRNPS
ncbi:MAG: hypothetical protein HYZ13_09390 [Acidobacteria bacterium]|nr:hypothetical protein [Acidobacteriota bacterium]